MPTRKTTRKPIPEVRSLATEAGFTGSFDYPTIAGPSVNEHTCLTHDAVWAAVNIFANTISTLNFYPWIRDPRGGRIPAYDHPTYPIVQHQPNEDDTSYVYRNTGVGHLKTRGNWYSEIVFDGKGVPQSIHILDPKNVNPRRDDNGKLWYHLVREKVDLPARNVIHVHGLGWDGLQGYSPIHMARNLIGLGLAQQNYAGALFGNGISPGGAVEVPGNLKEDSIRRLRDNLNSIHQGSERAGNVMLLQGGMKWVQTNFSPEDSEMIESMNMNVSSIARIFNLPQHMLGNLDKPIGVGGIEEQNIQFFQLSLLPDLTNIQEEFARKLLTPEERKHMGFRFDITTLLRGNSAAQTARETALFNIGALSINEIRSEEGLNPITGDGGSKHWVPTNNLTSVEDMDKAAETVATPMDSTDPTAPVETQVADVAAQAMNGAQIASLVEILNAVTAGTIPVESAHAVISASFPGIPSDQIDGMLNPLRKVETPAAPDAAPTEALDAVRDVLRESVGRCVRRECQAARRASRKPGFREWTESYYPDHATLLHASITPGLRALVAIGGNPHEVTQLVTGAEQSSASRTGCAEVRNGVPNLHQLVDRLVLESVDRLAGLVTTHPPDELPDAVDRVCSEWETTRTEAIINSL
jgi:HK97 family phage portal protein